MTLIASVLFLSALAVSILAIARTIGHAMPRILEIIEGEFQPVLATQRKVIYGTIRVQQKQSAQVVAFRHPACVEREFQLAA